MFDVLSASIGELESIENHFSAVNAGIMKVLVDRGIAEPEDFERAIAQCRAEVDQQVQKQKDEAKKELEKKFPGSTKILSMFEEAMDR